MKADEIKALKALARSRGRSELKALFALIRRHDDKALLGAIGPEPKRRSSKPVSLAREVEATLKPILGPASEKGEMLLEFAEAKHGVSLDFAPRGLADAVRQLRRRLSEAQIRDAARGLMAQVAERYAPRDTIV
ncbi:MAG: hypothetical protein ABUS57_19120 [Pseudomonadota bacterium]